MHGDPTDNNATLFYTGYYNGVLKPLFTSGKWKDVVNPPGTWDPPTALTSFQQAYTAHPNINAALIPNDENGAPIITYLKTKGVKPEHLPDHRAGRDPDGPSERALRLPVRDGLQGGLQGGPGRGCAGHLPPGRQDPAAVAGQRQHDGHQGTRSVPSVLLAPEWVTPTNMKDTIIKDNFVPTPQLCAGAYAAACKKAGIS